MRLSVRRWCRCPRWSRMWREARTWSWRRGSMPGRWCFPVSEQVEIPLPWPWFQTCIPSREAVTPPAICRPWKCREEVSGQFTAPYYLRFIVKDRSGDYRRGGDRACQVRNRHRCGPAEAGLSPIPLFRSSLPWKPAVARCSAVRSRKLTGLISMWSRFCACQFFWTSPNFSPRLSKLQ